MFDLIVIGSGPGGYVAAIRASQLGLNTAVVERSELGGVCLNWGCIPTKALLKSAQALHYANHASDYGFEIDGDVKADLGKIVERSRGVSANMSKGIEYLFKKNKITVIQGSGKIVSAGKVDVTANDGNVTSVEAKNIIIATGARANSLPFAPIDGKKIISYRQALVPDKLPASLAVIGSGAIGSELAYFYRSMGSEVHIIEYLDNIVPLEDDDVSAQLSRSFRKMGIKVMVSSKVKSVDISGELCKLTVETKKGEVVVEAEQVLSAVGVISNIENLGLEELGVNIERGKISVDSAYMTNVKGVYAIGDVIATPALAHVASAEAINCVEQIAGLNPPAVNYENIPGCTYTTPEIASVGITEKAAKERGLNIKVGKFPFTASGKAAAAGDKDGFVKLIVDADSDKVLGAHFVGANVTEMISGVVVARNLGV
ncbi:MAG: dihydrolipoyl dehydrogenase, partial [Bacteroidales bacterium]|nr:dihydrolipoyl dehydrogenase [Bacteroidales bacterium]